ncbi:hypothetical protein ACTZWW_15085 [Salinarimonas sp. NSM]|uniref:hypothetical protein n=1 Tax=Salinarimonas sp. NSM TaxID=3458003 RepID=UPI0040375766
MARPVPYVFCRYSLVGEGGALSAQEQLQALRRVRGTPVPHRKAEPEEDDFDTLIIRPSLAQVDGFSYLTFEVAQEVTGRSLATYDRERDAIRQRWDAGRFIRWTSFISVPRLGVLAASDRSGDAHLSASAGIARFKTVMRMLQPELELDIIPAATQEEARRALTEWALEKFTFTVRPFNPHPRSPGDKLSELFKRDGIGSLRGVAVPAADAKMHMTDGGYIEETVGLASAGYGQFGLEGSTPGGRKAALKKPQFSMERERNEKVQASPQQIRVFIEPHERFELEYEEAAKALIEVYGR